MTVFKLVGLAKSHLCRLAQKVDEVLRNQQSTDLMLGTQLGAILANQQLTITTMNKLHDITADRLAAVEAQLAEIRAAVIEDDMAAGITLTIEKQEKL